MAIKLSIYLSIYLLALHTLNRYITIIRWTCAGNGVCGIKASILHLQLWGLSHCLSVKTTQCQRPGSRPAPKRCQQIAGNNI